MNKIITLSNEKKNIPPQKNPTTAKKKLCFGCVMRIRRVILCEGKSLGLPESVSQQSWTQWWWHNWQTQARNCWGWQLYSCQSWLMLIPHKTPQFLARDRCWVSASLSRSWGESVFLPCLELTWRARGDGVPLLPHPAHMSSLFGKLHCRRDFWWSH